MKIFRGGTHIMLRTNALAIMIIAAFTARMAAQTPSDPAPIVINRGAAAGVPPRGLKAGVVTMHVEDMDADRAKGAPFCATVTTDHTQTFADGNRIHTSDNSTLCRDSDGRTRREAGLNLMGAAEAQPPLPKLITIVDPVAGFRYMLDSDNKIAHRMPINGPGAMGFKIKGGAAGAAEKGEHAMFYQRVGTAGPNMVMSDNVMFKQAGQSSDGPAPATENLVDQVIDGIHATGTRVITTIPAGRMGNEQPILVTSERWYSPELKATIMTKHTDPWAGELKTQFTNVNTAEPDSSLFAVPSDYKIVDEKAGPFVIQKQLPAPPEQ
jgi:hypothetical protein